MPFVQPVNDNEILQALEKIMRMLFPGSFMSTVEYCSTSISNNEVTNNFQKQSSKGVL